MKTKQRVSSWHELDATIGNGIVNQIKNTDALNHAQMICAVILDSGYRVYTDGKQVYTDHPMDEATTRGWIAYQPALRRVFNE